MIWWAIGNTNTVRYLINSLTIFNKELFKNKQQLTITLLGAIDYNYAVFIFNLLSSALA